MTKPTFGQIIQTGHNYAEFQVHTAESKWQFCMCPSCQDRRLLIDRMPGTKIDYATYRKKDERY